MYQLGVLGGMGPESTALFFKRVVEFTRAGGDQEHIPSVILNATKIPDRTDALLQKGPSPLADLQKGIDDLCALGVSVIASPCNTAHAFFDRLNVPSGVELLNMVRLTLDAAGTEYPLCVLGTTGLNRVGVYERTDRAAHRFTNLADPEQTLVMDAITAVKAGEHENAAEYLFAAVDSIRSKTPDALFLLSCTELSVLQDRIRDRFPFLDALDVLARAAVLACGYELK